MELTGKLINVGDCQEGQGARGPWKKQQFVIETMEQYPKKIVMTAWGDRVNDLEFLYIGDTLTVKFDLDSREYNGRWYLEAKAWDIKGAQQQPQGAPAQIPNPPQQPLPPTTDGWDLNPNDNDLRF